MRVIAIRLFTFLTICLIYSYSVRAQVDSIFSQSELEVFTQIYLEENSQNTADDEWILPYLSKESISKERYGAYIRAKINGKTLKLTSQEEQGLQTIIQAISQEEEKRKNNLSKLCKTRNLNLHKYQLILNQYHTSPEIRSKINSIIKRKVEQE